MATAITKTVSKPKNTSSAGSFGKSTVTGIELYSYGWISNDQDSLCCAHDECYFRCWCCCSSSASQTLLNIVGSLNAKGYILVVIQKAVCDLFDIVCFYLALSFDLLAQPDTSAYNLKVITSITFCQWSVKVSLKIDQIRLKLFQEWMGYGSGEYTLLLHS